MRYQKTILTLVGLAFLITGLAASGCSGWAKRMPFIKSKFDWSIGIYEGTNPFNLTSPNDIRNPVLTAKDVHDVPAEFVADPFIAIEDSTWYMFFEVMNRNTNQGDIGLATSDNGREWQYQQIVLDEPFHLSYPYVFKWNGEYYMIPETSQKDSLRLYRAIDFPESWSYVRTLLSGTHCDASIFRHDGRWWLFSQTNPKGNNVLRLYYAETLLGSWTEHPESPIVSGNANIARPGGRVLVFYDRMIRYAQDDYSTYGNQVRAFEITNLTISDYEESEVRESPVLKASGADWHRKGMHHIDVHRIEKNKWRACVDGRSNGLF